MEIRVWVRRSRKARRLSVSVDARTGRPHLVIPFRVTYAEADQFLQLESKWLLNKLKELPPKIPFENGASVPLLGHKCCIKHLPLLPPEVSHEGHELVVGGKNDEIKHRITEWLKNLARQKLTELASQKIQATEHRSPVVNVRDPTTRWGSCSKNGRLSFSWRLILAPPSVMDYVVAHEVAHLSEFHHGPNFWLLVKKLCPGYRRSKHWLTRHGATLLRYG